MAEKKRISNQAHSIGLFKQTYDLMDPGVMLRMHADRMPDRGRAGAVNIFLDSVVSIRSFITGDEGTYPWTPNPAFGDGDPEEVSLVLKRGSEWFIENRLGGYGLALALRGGEIQNRIVDLLVTDWGSTEAEYFVGKPVQDKVVEGTGDWLPGQG